MTKNKEYNLALDDAVKALELFYEQAKKTDWPQMYKEGVETGIDISIQKIEALKIKNLD